MIKKAHIFYHNDLDGRFAAFYMYQYIKRYLKQYRKTEFYEVDYAKTIDLDRIYNTDLIVFVDYSFTNPNNLYQLKKAVQIDSKKVIWIDHHESSKYIASEEFDALLARETSIGNFSIYIDTVYSATKLVWYWIMSRVDNHAGNADLYACGPVPRLVDIVNAYDTFHLDAIKGAEEFNYGMGTSKYTPKYLYMDIFGNKHNASYNIFDKSDAKTNAEIDKFIDKKIRAGYIIKKDRETTYSYNLAGMAFEVNIRIYEGKDTKIIRGLAMNIHGNSFAFLDKYEEYDFVSPFYMTKDGLWKYSLFSKSKDYNLHNVVLEICKGEFGGISAGGHASACGMILKQLIYSPGVTININRNAKGIKSILHPHKVTLSYDLKKSE